jgi:hypothetical protein
MTNDKSKSDKFFENRKLPPIVSSAMYKNVSQYRRGMLADEVDKGLYRDGSTKAEKNKYETTAASYVASLQDIKKTANYGYGESSGAVGEAWRGSNGQNTVRQMPEVYSPLWLNSNLNLPRDRATINAWNRSFYALNPAVHNAINLHATYPISKLSIKCPNKKVEQFFSNMVEELDLMNVCVQIAQEYWLLGEAFVYAELDEAQAKWSRIIVQNPDYIVVKRSVMANEPIIMLRPDENLRRIVFSNRPADLEQKSQLNPTIIEHIKRGENIPLDNFYVSHIARRISPYEIRGTGLPVCCYRQLMCFDYLIESKIVQAQSMITPLTIVKIGSADYKPTLGDIEAWRNVFAAAEFDKNFKIFTHEGVAVERVGWNSAVMDVSNDITQLLKEIYMGLMVPSVLMDGGGDITYANGGVSLDVLRQRYFQFRNKMAAWLKEKIFAPISKLNDFYDFEDGVKKLIIPEVEWNHMSLFETMDYVNVLVQLSGDQKKVSQQTLYKSLGLDYDDERRKIRKEDISEAIRKKELMTLDRMPLNELRGLSEQDEIPEIVDAAVPSDSPYTDQGQQGAGAGGGGMLPPLPGMAGGDIGGGAGSLPPPPPAPGGPPGGGAPPPTPPPAT